MKLQKAFVRNDNTAVIKCPKCRKAKSIAAEQYKKHTKSFKVRCTCKHVFNVKFEFRKTYRKETYLIGSYSNKSLPGPQVSMIVRNISLTGLGFDIHGKHSIEKGHVLQVEFRLDTASQDLIQEEVIVKLVKANFLGCEFTETKALNKALGFYLLP